VSSREHASAAMRTIEKRKNRRGIGVEPRVTFAG
jgi:hypothetical protein